MTTGCLFCQIIAGTVPAEKIYEDEHTLAFLDIKPVNPGHALVIPKQHYENLLAMPEAEAEHLFVSVKRVAEAIQAAIPSDAFNIGMNNGAAAGQIIFHAHVHIMPRTKKDHYEPWHGKEYRAEEMKSVAAAIRTQLNN
jgi:histidine triad (HIT) family protein